MNQAPVKYTSETMTAETRRKIIESIEETQRFITKEEKRNSDLRPAAVQKTLDFYKAHKIKLNGMLAKGLQPDFLA